MASLRKTMRKHGWRSDKAGSYFERCRPVNESGVVKVAEELGAIVERFAPGSWFLKSPDFSLTIGRLAAVASPAPVFARHNREAFVADEEA